MPEHGNEAQRKYEMKPDNAKNLADCIKLSCRTGAALGVYNQA